MDNGYNECNNFYCDLNNILLFIYYIHYKDCQIYLLKSLFYVPRLIHEFFCVLINKI